MTDPTPSSTADPAAVVGHVRAVVSAALHPDRVGPVTVQRTSALLARSERERRLFRKWPWTWGCNLCDDGYGAGKTEDEARQKADQHIAQLHSEVGEQAGG